MKKEIKNTVKVLSEGGVIVYPTDTIWGIGCDATNEKAVESIFKIKKRTASKSLIILVDGWEMLQKYIKKIPAKVSCVLEGSSRPTTVIYKKPVNLAKNVVASDNTVAIRIVDDDFCKQMIKRFGKPVVSTSANTSGKPHPRSFSDIETSILNDVDYAVNLYRDKKFALSSQIVRIQENGKIDFLRK